MSTFKPLVLDSVWVGALLPAIAPLNNLYSVSVKSTDKLTISKADISVADYSRLGISFWFDMSVSVQCTIISQLGTLLADRTWYAFIDSTGKLNISVYTSAGTLCACVSPYAVTKGWHHVFLKYNVDDVNVFQVWLDGVELPIIFPGVALEPINNSATDLIIGGDPGINPTGITGRIDELSYFSGLNLPVIGDLYITSEQIPTDLLNIASLHSWWRLENTYLEEKILGTIVPTGLPVFQAIVPTTFSIPYSINLNKLSVGYGQLPDLPNLPDSNNVAWSVFFKTNKIGGTTNQFILSEYGALAGAHRMYANITGTGLLSVTLYGANGTFAFDAGTRPISQGWHHLMVSYSTSDIATGAFKSFLDGTEIFNSNALTGPVRETAVEFMVGNYAASPLAANNFDGLITSPCIVSGINPVSGITPSYFINADGTPKNMSGTPGLVHWWPIKGVISSTPSLTDFVGVFPADLNPIGTVNYLADSPKPRYIGSKSSAFITPNILSLTDTSFGVIPDTLNVGISVWFYFTDNAASNEIISKRNIGNTSGLRIYNTGIGATDAISVSFDISNTVFTGTVFNASTVLNTGWNHIYTTFNGNNANADKMQIFINGTRNLDNIPVISGNSFITGNGDINIGANNNISNINGNIDEVAIFSGVLPTVSEIRDPLIGRPKELIHIGSLYAWWKMDNDWTDSSVNGNKTLISVSAPLFDTYIP